MLSKEDKHDVKTHMGKALANKVSKATDDRRKVPVRHGSGYNSEYKKVVIPGSMSSSGKRTVKLTKGEDKVY